MAFDASGNIGSSPPVSINVAGAQASCGSSGWSCAPGGGPLHSDCLAEWLVRSDVVISRLREKAKVSCVDGSPCDVDGAADGTGSFPVSICFAVSDARLLARQGGLACDAEDLDAFQLLVPSYRRASTDPIDRANAQALLSAVAALSTGQMEGRCAVGAEGRKCAEDAACDTLSTVHDGVCSFETTSLAAMGGVEICTAEQWVRVPLRRRAGSVLRRAAKTLKVTTSAVAEGERPPRDADVLNLECLPAS